MGKQYNKVEKRKRRLSYIKRKKATLKNKKPATSAAIVDTGAVAPAASA
jgi:hypothetical protein